MIWESCNWNRSGWLSACLGFITARFLGVDWGFLAVDYSGFWEFV